MAQFTTEYKRAFLRSAWEAAPLGADTLMTYLMAAMTGRIQETASGRIVQGTSSAGHSVNFFIPAHAAVTPSTIAELCEELISLYESVAETLSTENEDSIYAEMLAELRSVKGFTSNFSYLAK